MFNVWIFEDNKFFADQLIAELENYKKILVNKVDIDIIIELVNDNFSERIEEIIATDKGGMNLFILDIDLKDEHNGIQLAKKIREKDKMCNMIFVSSHVELMSSIFTHNLKVVSFIDKMDPHFKERLHLSLDSIVEEQTMMKSIINKVIVKSESLKYSYKGQFYRIPFDGILGIETNTLKRGLVINTTSKSYPTNISIKKMIELLPSQFLQTHRSIIVNTEFIREIRNEDSMYSIVMNNDSVYPASQKYVSMIIEKISK